MTPPASSKPSQTWLWIYVSAFLLRMANNFFGVFSPIGVIPVAADSFFHMHRIRWATEHGFQVPDVERYLNFPTGAHTYWPYGFDLVYAAFARLITPLHPDPWWTFATASVVTPLISALTPCLVFEIGKTLGSKRLGIWSAFLCVILPSITMTGSIGYVDHHVFESFWLAVYLLAYLKALTLRESHLVKARWLARLAGVAMTAGVLFTTVLPILLPLHTGVVVCQIVREWRKSNTTVIRQLIELNSFVYTAFAVTLLPFVTLPIAEPNGINPALIFSWLFGFGLASTVLILLNFWKLQTNDKPGIPFQWRFGMCLLALGLVLVQTNLSSALSFLEYGIGHLLRGDPWVATVQENLPLWYFPASRIFGMFSGFVVVWPVAIGLMLKRGWEKSPLLWAVTLLGIVQAGITVLQLRFCGFATVTYALTLGYLVTAAIEWLYQRFDLKETTTVREIKGLVCFVGGLLIWLGMLWPILANIVYPTAFIGSVSPMFFRLFPTLQWINRHTPPVSPQANATTDYCIAADWIAGHWIVLMGNRPVLASPMEHTQSHREGIHDGAAALMLPPEAAFHVMERRRIRYLLVTDIQVTTFLEAAYWDLATNQIAFPRSQTETIQQALYFRLLRDAIPANDPAARVLRHLRLVHEAPSAGEEIPYARLFERVPGVELSGTTQPNAEVRLTAQLYTSNGRLITYADAVTADATGKFQVVVPYAAGQQAHSEVRMLTPYKIESAGNQSVLVVTEAEVLSGAKREVNWNEELRMKN